MVCQRESFAQAGAAAETSRATGSAPMTSESVALVGRSWDGGANL